MKKHFVLDTNVLLHDASCLESFADNVVVFPANPTGWHKQSPAGNVLLVDRLPPVRQQVLPHRRSAVNG